eukprot:GHVT01020400.1.p1 GENE.GHVT01020400.1~~GHVT01020400.1.p1  ORF type:complete len:344 (-),score=102.77 GHVT01020400.1:300-1277(-)
MPSLHALGLLHNAKMGKLAPQPTGPKLEILAHLSYTKLAEALLRFLLEMCGSLQQPRIISVAVRELLQHNSSPPCELPSPSFLLLCLHQASSCLGVPCEASATAAACQAEDVAETATHFPAWLLLNCGLSYGTVVDAYLQLASSVSPDSSGSSRPGYSCRSLRGAVDSSGGVAWAGPGEGEGFGRRPALTFPQLCACLAFVFAHWLDGCAAALPPSYTALLSKLQRGGQLPLLDRPAAVAIVGVPRPLRQDATRATQELLAVKQNVKATLRRATATFPALGDQEWVGQVAAALEAEERKLAAYRHELLQLADTHEERGAWHTLGA